MVQNISTHGAYRSPTQFDYVVGEGDDRIYAYFGSYLSATFYQLTHPAIWKNSMITRAAGFIERRAEMYRDVVDPKSAPTYSNPQSIYINDMNRPEQNTSIDGTYYGFDITGLLHMYPQVRERLNSPGINHSNCITSALMYLGISHDEAFVDPTTVDQILHDTSRFVMVDSQEPEDLVYWYSQIGSFKVTIHVYIDLGYGWAFTKNGSDDEQPYRFQRIENMSQYFREQGAYLTCLFGKLKGLSCEAQPIVLHEERYRVMASQSTRLPD